MASHLYRRKAGGIWWADYTDPSGERHRFCTRVADKKAAATILAQRERDAAAQAAAGLASDAAGRTIEDLTWHLAVEAHTNTSGKPISAGTRMMYREKGGHLNRLLRVCGGCAVNGDLTAVEDCEAKHGSIELTKLKCADVVRYIDHRIAEGAARTTIKKELNTLSVALKHAGNRGWVPHSAAIECVPPFAAQSEPRTRWLTHDEFPKFLAALDTTGWMAKRVSDLEPDQAKRKLREHGEHGADRQRFDMVACFTDAECLRRVVLAPFARSEPNPVGGTIGRSCHLELRRAHAAKPALRATDWGLVRRSDRTRAEWDRESESGTRRERTQGGNRQS